MLSYVCDRCRKIIPSTDTKKMVRLQFQNDSADRNIDLCSKCFGLFDEFILSGKDDPVEMSLAEDGFECPCCHTHYVFEVTEDRRINLLRRTSDNIVEIGNINREFFRFNCPQCAQLLTIPESVLKEAYK